MKIVDFKHSSLDGDLRNILLQATQTEVQQRYLSVADLNQDLLNWLQHKPIMATKQTVRYRVKKFISRNKAVSTLLPLVFISLLVGLMTTYNQKQIAQFQADKANEVKMFLLDTLASSDPDVAAGKDISVKDLLLEAQGKLSQKPLINKVLHAELLQTIGVSLGKIGEYDLAIKQLQQAQGLTDDFQLIEASIIDLLFAYKSYEQALSKLDSLWLESDETFKNSFHMIKLKVQEKSYLGQFEAAEKIIVDQLAQLNSDGENQDKRIELKLMLAAVYANNTQSTQSAQTEKLLAQTLILSTEYHGAVHSKTIEIMLELAETYENNSGQGVEQSLAYLQRILTLQTQLYQTAHPKIVTTLVRLANNHKALGQNQEALNAAQKAKSMAIQLYGENDNILAARADVSLSHLSLKTGDLTAAIEQLQAAVSVFENHYGTDHFETNQYKTNLATYLLKAGESQRALTLLDELYARQALQLGPAHRATLYVQLNRIKALSALTKYQQAIEIGDQAFSLSQKELGEEQVITVGIELALGVAYFENKQYQLALKHLSNRETSAIVRSNSIYHNGLLKQLITAALNVNNLSQAQSYYATLSSGYSNADVPISEQQQSELSQLSKQIADSAELNNSQ